MKLYYVIYFIKTITMKLTTIFTLTFTLLLSGVKAGYNRGFITGMMVSDFNANRKTKTIEYDKMTIDTSLFDFPIQKNPKCIEIEIYKPLTLKQKIFSSIITMIMIMVPVHMCIHGTDDDREFMVGVFMGHAYSKYKNSRRY